MVRDLKQYVETEDLHKNEQVQVNTYSTIANNTITQTQLSNTVNTLTDYQQNVVQLIAKQIADSDYDYNLAVTLNFPQSKRNGMAIDAMNNTLRHWTHKTNKILFGHNWKKNGTGLRYFAFAELTESFPHFHLITGVPEAKIDYAPQVLCNRWLQMTGSDGRIYSAKWEHCFNSTGWIEYCVKEITKDRNNYWSEAQILAKEW